MTGAPQPLPAHPVGRAILKGAIAVAGLVAVRIIVLHLPMLADASPVLISSLFTGNDTLVTPAVIARTIIDTLIFAALLVAARDVQVRIAHAGGRLPAAGTMVLLASVILVLVLAYASYTPVFSALIGDAEVYDGIFLVAGVVALGALVVVLYRNLDSITDIVFRSSASALGRAQQSPPAPLRCSSCSASVPGGARFCASCGSPVEAP